MIRVILFIIGLISFTLLLGWLVGMFLYVVGDSPYCGAIAYLPKWIFLLSAFLIFYRSRPVRRFFQRLEEIFF